MITPLSPISHAKAPTIIAAALDDLCLASVQKLLLDKLKPKGWYKAFQLPRSKYPSLPLLLKRTATHLEAALEGMEEIRDTSLLLAMIKTICIEQGNGKDWRRMQEMMEGPGILKVVTGVAGAYRDVAKLYSKRALLEAGAEGYCQRLPLLHSAPLDAKTGKPNFAQLREEYAQWAVSPDEPDPGLTAKTLGRTWKDFEAGYLPRTTAAIIAAFPKAEVRKTRNR